MKNTYIVLMEERIVPTEEFEIEAKSPKQAIKIAEKENPNMRAIYVEEV